MITAQEKSAIKQMLQSPQWKVIQSMSDELIKGWQNQSKLGETLWKTARNVVRDEGKCEGVRTLFQELFKLASE